MNKYIHDDNTHNTNAAEILVPFLFELLPVKPTSVVDLGCGLGTWLKVFNDFGVNDAVGYEGSHLDLSMLKVSPSNVLIHDLETPIIANKKYDLAISLEVAEHLKPESADFFIESLVNLSDVVLFSAAVVAQGGQNHLNEQKPDYWREKFLFHGYDCFDIIRKEIWDNEKIDHWYRQNIILYAKKGTLPFVPCLKAPMYIHPVLYMQVLTQRNWLARISGYSIWEKIKKHYRRNFKNSV